MAGKTEYRVSLEAKMGYNRRRTIAKVFKSLPAAVKFAHRAMGWKDEQDPRNWKKRPKNKHPWWGVRITNWTNYETLLSLYLEDNG